MAIVNQVVICGGTGCMSGNSEAIRDAFLKELQELGIQDEVQVFMSGCFGLCEKGPVVVVFPDMTFYAHMTEKDVKEICEEHLLKGRVVTRKAYAEVNEQKVKVIETQLHNASAKLWDDFYFQAVLLQFFKIVFMRLH